MIFKGQDAWRTHPLFQRLWMRPFPGFGNAAIIFGVYLGAEYAMKSIQGKPAVTAHDGHGHH